MDEISQGMDPDELMDMEEPDGSDVDEEDEELIDEPVQSPFLLSSGPGSTTTSVASSPPHNEDFQQPFISGKPLSIKRGRGRPRRGEGGKPLARAPRNFSSTGMTRVRKPRPPGFSRRGGGRSFRQPDRSDYEMSLFSSSPDDMNLLDPETGNFIYPEREKLPAIMDEPPYFMEHWPGKVCAFCNLGERSQLGQGMMLRLNCPEGFSPQKEAAEQALARSLQTPENSLGDKSPKGPVTCRRQKSFNKCRHPSMTNEHIDELTIIGYTEIPEVTTIFENTGQFYVHRSCALWSNGVKRKENMVLENVGPVVLQSSSKKCSFCNHYGASVICNMESCTKIYHFPCATAAGAFQELLSLTTFCTNHLSQVAMLCESSVCYTCKNLGDIANLIFCSTCGTHYHGTCVGLAQLPGVRAGWQCRKCRCCQVCRVTGDESKLMSCEQCDKVYHAGCQRPIVTSIPKYGWKCRCCRVCGDCGSRTPGAGLSSRWHSHYTVCDSCYQQRNKGYSCPLCQRAYRAHAHREMVQCTSCKKFVHGTCDPEADLTVYNQKKDLNPDYEYICLCCKNKNQSGRQLVSKRFSTEDPNELSASQESLYDDTSEFDLPSPDEFARNMGLGKGKPYSANKIAKKRLGFSTGLPGRPKGTGKGLPGKLSLVKRNRLNDFARKRGPKAKMRGVFGVPGVGLQRPTYDGKSDDEFGVENRLVLFSARDKFVFTQDMCVMCGALGTDQEGCLISCVQCGQCYHPYCINVKVTKVILQKGWRCLDCVVCEGCGQRNDESRLILCDDCDISFHIYCMDPPLDYVPHGNWKCKWCAICQTCGATTPGFNCTWMNSCTQCGPCASHITCPSCSEPYLEGDLIIQCVQCERWLHGACDFIKTEEDAEKCAEEGYNCNLCRPRDVPPPHLIPAPVVPKPPPPSSKSPEPVNKNNYFIDGVYLSESGHSFIKSLTIDHGPRKKRKKLPTLHDKEAGIMATIESVVAGGNTDNNLEENPKLELVEMKDEPQELYKEGMMWSKEDGPPPEGFTIFTMENGFSVLRRKRQRNLQKLGIGGFLVRMRGVKGSQDNDEIDTLAVQTNGISNDSSQPVIDGDKPKRKAIRRKPKSKLAETFPTYLQEAFFGKEILDSVDTKREFDSFSSDDEETKKYDSIKLSQDELSAIAAITAKQTKTEPSKIKEMGKISKFERITLKEEEDDNTEDLKDMLALPGDLLDTDLVNSIINDDDDELTKNTGSLEALDTNLTEDSDLADTLGSAGNSKDTKDELSDILGSHFNLESIHIPNINSKDVEDLFKGVLTDESQESQESNSFPIQNNTIFSNNIKPNITQPPSVPQVRSSLPIVNQPNINSPVSFPPPSPYHSEYSNPQFSPAFSEPPPSPWVGVNDNMPDIDSSSNVGIPSTYNQRSSEKMKVDELLGNSATISAVLYANVNHPEWKKEYTNWSDRYKQIIKKWRTLSQEQKAPYLQQARDNRSQLRMKKAQQDQEKVASQQKSAKEAEQERQWKQLQALRQQQAQQQQHVIHEQRVQAIARVQRQISTDPSSQQFLPTTDQRSPLQVATGNQELSPAASPSPGSRQFLGIKSPTYSHGIRPQTPSPALSDFQQVPAADSTDIYQSPPTPKPNFQTRLSVDPFAQQPATPRPQFSTNKQTLQTLGATPRSDPQEINRQLRDLLQRQQFKKLDVPGKGQQRVWPPTDQQEVETPTTPVSSADTTFRQPLPPGMRPRIAVSTLGRPGLAQAAMKIAQIDPRMQGLDPRTRLIIQQHQQRLVNAPAQNLQQQQLIRFASGVRPASVEQYEQLLNRQHGQNAQVHRLPLNQSTVIQRPQMPPTQMAAAHAAQGETPTNEEGIPDNVTAELEKLEQETGTMAELQGVSDILGGLGDDDDELLAEMGPDFNILEYADPELEALTGGKTNILDLELEEEPVKKDTKAPVSNPVVVSEENVKHSVPSSMTSSNNMISNNKSNAPPEVLPNLPPPPLAAAQEPVIQQSIPIPVSVQQTSPLTAPAQNVQSSPVQFLTTQQIHQHMIRQVQNAIAQGRPMPVGSKMTTPDGIVGIVTSNNSVHLQQVPAAYQERMLLQFQNQKLQMRLGSGIQSRLVQVTQNPQVASGLAVGPRIGLPAPPPPPPPYPGPPPPYPGNKTTQQQSAHQQSHQEQPLLLEDLLEQEKREQEKLQPVTQEVSSSTTAEGESTLLSDQDFERLKADVFSSGSVNLSDSGNPALISTTQHQPWQQTQNRQVAPPTSQATTEMTTRVQMFNANLIPAPAIPPENIVTEQDKQAQILYEQWLNHQNNVLTQQLRYYETEVQKLRKSRKSLNSKQRQLRKSGNQLAEADANELQRISAEQAILQKHLESSRKQSRQHGLLIQEYRNKQQAKQRPGQSPLQQIHSPLGPPSSSPIHHPSTSQSPMMSPSASASPITQHSSPMNSPGPIISPSPGVQNILQSPGGNLSSSMSPVQTCSSQPSPMQSLSMQPSPIQQSTMQQSPMQSSQMQQPSPMQQSPRIGTPHSQTEGSPGPIPSPSQVCLPPPAPRMTSPQHRRMVTSPVAAPQIRFVSNASMQQRVRKQATLTTFQQKPGTSPLNSPPFQQLQQLQKQFPQATILQQQSLEANQAEISQSRAAQLLQQRNLIRQQLTNQQQQQQSQQSLIHQQQSQQSLILQQQSQQSLIHQQQISVQQQKLTQQHMAQIQARLQQQHQQQNNPPSSPMPPKSPMLNQQIMSPHSMPPSPMQIPPKSPMLSFNSNQQTPNSPIARSPVYHQGMNQPPSPMTQNQYQTPNSPIPISPMLNQNPSPHGMRRPPSANSSPAIPDRPASVENPSPRTPFSIDHLVQDNHSSMQYSNDMLQYGNDSNLQQNNRDNYHSGGGNPNNPCNPIPIPAKFGYFKLGLRGGAPMWSYGRGAKRIPTPPGSAHSVDDKSLPNDIKTKKESHLNKVSILRRKTNPHHSAVTSSDSADYNEIEDSSSSTPPITPPPSSSSNKLFHKNALKKNFEQDEAKDSNILVLHNAVEKPLDIMDYDDDTNTVISGEISLSSAAQQNDTEDIVEIESLSQPDIADTFSSPLESDQIPDEYLLFPGNMVVDMANATHFSDKEEDQEAEYSSGNMHIVIRSPTTSDDEFILQSKAKKYNAVSSSSKTIAGALESPEQESSPNAPVEGLTNYDSSEMLMIDSNTKSPEDSISTKEDFEELIDERSRKENLRKCDITSKSIPEFHPYSNILSYTQNIQQKPQTQSSIKNNSSKPTQSLSLMTSPIVHTVQNKNNSEKIIVTQNAKLMNTSHQTSKVTGIILTHNSSVRGNVLNVPKIVNSVSPSITIVSGSNSQIASILPSKFTVPVISASAVRHLSNVKVLDKPSSSISLTTHDNSLPKKIFEDDSVSPDSSNFEDEKSKDSCDEKTKTDLTPDEEKPQQFPKSISEKFVTPEELESSKQQTKKIEHLQISNLSQKSRIPSPIISKSSPVIIHNTPELKMTAQVIQETPAHLQITGTTENISSYDSIEDTKSVVISIPSPTPSQEQMLDNIALQALENRRREFDSFDDVLDMIENITAEPPPILEENSGGKSFSLKQEPKNTQISKNITSFSEPSQPTTDKTESINITTSTKSSIIPQLSPLSQPTDLTADMANASQQLRSLLSSYQTTSTSSSTNVESVVRNLTVKGTNNTSSNSKQPIVASRIIQQTTKLPIVTNANTVIVPNLKQKIAVSSVQNQVQVNNPIRIQHISTSNATFNIITSRAGSAGIQVLADNSKSANQTTTANQTTSVITTPNSAPQKATMASKPTPTETRKPSLTLTAMLQNQPAATMTAQPTTDTITAASLLGSPISLANTGFTSALIQAQPNPALLPITTSKNSLAATLSSPTVITSSAFKVTSSPTLLHTHLSKRAKSTDDSNDNKNLEIRDKPDVLEETKFSSSNNLKSDNNSKFPKISTAIHSGKPDDSQNVLLKKLLQNTACASTQSSSSSATLSSITTVNTPVSRLSNVENTVKSSAPTLSSLLPSVVVTTETQVSAQSYQKNTTVSRAPIRETSFVSNPTVTTIPPVTIPTPTTVPSNTQQQLHIDVKKCGPPARTPSRDELLSPPTPRSSCSQESSLQTPPLVIKKEFYSNSQQQTQPSPVSMIQDVKKELIDESSQQSEVSDHSRSDVPIKDEEPSDAATEKIIDKEQLKKQKRRMYQQKRRQNQILNKEQANQPKKRPRKNSKIEEDYDTYIDGVLVQLRQLPPMNVCEPKLNRNFAVVPIFGTGDMSKFGTKKYSFQCGDLVGTFGNAYLPGYTDFYSTEPFGDIDPLPEKAAATTQRGFYDQEFPLIKFDIDEEKKLNLFCRDDTPDSIISTSSPECFEEKSQFREMGLKLINEDDEDDIESEHGNSSGRFSPIVKIVKPIPIRLKPAGGFFLKDSNDNKENIHSEMVLKPKSEPKSTTPVKDNGNVTVTLTLTSSAAENIMGVLRDLANILHIPAPTSYQIVERTTTPPSQKLGLYRTKGKDGREGAPIDIQSILNGTAKFCKHCDVVILNNMICKKISDLAFLAKDFDLLNDGEEIYFCSSACYMQFALMHRSPSISEDKAAAIIDHLSQKDQKHKKHIADLYESNKSVITQKISQDLRDFRRDHEPKGEFSSLFQHQTDQVNTKYNENVNDYKVAAPRFFKNVRYKNWMPDCLQPNQKHKRLTDKEIMELLYRMQITVVPPKMPDDTRKCIFCQSIGDGVADGPARLLNFDVDKWVHLNCGLWSDGVYETVNGALMNLENAIQMSLTTICIHCNRYGATIRCFKNRCSSVYHLSCAVKDKCVFFKNKTVYCSVHVPKNEKDNELTTLSVWRRVYVNRDENRQVAAVMHHSETNFLLRVGSLIFLNVGQILPHQLQNFHTPNYIYPIGYKIIRLYWSMRRLNKRCRYICSIHDVCGRPEFRVLVQEQPEEDVEFRNSTPKGVWQNILDQVATLRKNNDCLQIFPKFVTGEDLFGLTEPAIVRVLESLPGIETLTDYKFKYGRNPLLELPLAINPSGSARTEPRLRTQIHWKRPHTQRTTGSTVRPLFGPSPSGPLGSLTNFGEMSCPYSKQFVHSKSSQYKKMKQEWRNNVFLARSKIQGLGLYAARDLEKHTMVIEYIGEIIRTELAECREKQYEAKNRGIYMFRLDEERVVDATLSGGLARYINHSCNPNCVAETVEVERDVRIIIFSKRRIQRGEELSYDYKFDIEDDQNKISCMCGAPNCRKWMN